MKLTNDWKAVLKKAWSIRLIIVAGLFSGLEVALPFLDFLQLPRGVFAVLSFVATGGAFITRLIAQKGLTAEPKDDQSWQ